MRKADVTWVEEMTHKHNDLPTDVLILYSRSGFTKAAVDKENFTKFYNKRIGLCEPVGPTFRPLRIDNFLEIERRFLERQRRIKLGGHALRELRIQKLIALQREC
jgi:hypothetical protein